MNNNKKKINKNRTEVPISTVYVILIGKKKNIKQQLQLL